VATSQPTAVRPVPGNAAGASAPLRSAPPDSPLSRLGALSASRVGSLPAASRALLLLAALEGTGDLGVLAAAAGRSGVLDGFPPLEQSLVVSVDEHTRRLVFLHPLAQDTVVGMSTAAERRRAHRALARTLADQPDRQAWHLAEATVAPDEQVAVLLERTAQASLRRGDAPGAVRALTRAAELSPRRPDRGRRLVEAACIGAEATGQVTREAQLLADARQAGPQSIGSLQAAISIAHLLLNAGCDNDSAHRLLVGAILAYGDHYDAGDAMLAEALHSLLMISWYEGSPQLGKPFNDAIARIVPEAHAALQQELTPAQITASVYADRMSGCREALWRVIRDGWEGGAIAAAINTLVSSCVDDWLTGQWDVAPGGTAIALGQEALAVTGSWLRLKAALDIFERQGAQPWARRAGGGLRAAGLSASPSRSPGTAQLTHQQLEIATLAASGLTNKQIAERLYLSHRTVSAHLYKLFPKLGVTSRGALRAALASPPPQQAGEDSHLADAGEWPQGEAGSWGG
jgi:DNA-binding CsgD family transcriptional regulator